MTVLKILVNMANAGVSTAVINPFNFENKSRQEQMLSNH